MVALKKLYISIFTFIMVVIVFVTVLFAFESQRINNVSGLKFTASSGDELQMSLDGINYFTSLPNSELEKIFANITLIDVTSTDGINFTTGGLRPVEPAIPNEHYITFDLWIRTARPERSIYLINNLTNTAEYQTNEIGTYVLSQGAVWFAKTGFFNGPTTADWVEKGSVGKYYSKNAIRIAVIEQVDELNPLDTRTQSELKHFIFDPSEDPTRGFGVPYGAFSYFFQRTRMWVHMPTEIPVVSYRLSQMDPNNPYQALDNESMVANLQETDQVDHKDRTYYQSKVRISIWIEGWDADAFDAIDRDQLRIQLQFKAARPANN